MFRRLLLNGAWTSGSALTVWDRYRFEIDSTVDGNVADGSALRVRPLSRVEACSDRVGSNVLGSMYFAAARTGRCTNTAVKPARGSRRHIKYSQNER